MANPPLYDPNDNLIAKYFSSDFDRFEKSHELDSTVKSSRCKARESLGVRCAYQHVAMTKDEAQRRSLDLASAGRWTFYEAVNFLLDNQGLIMT